VVLSNFWICRCNRAVLIFDDLRLDATAWEHAVRLAQTARCTVALHDFTDVPSGLN